MGNNAQLSGKIIFVKVKGLGLLNSSRTSLGVLILFAKYKPLIALLGIGRHS
jgi:hypothetical protein